MFMNMYVHGYVYVYDSICWALKCPVHCAEPFLELKMCISPQFRAIDPPNPARGFIQQNENVRFATAACMQKYGNVSFATVACAKCMRYGGRGGGPIPWGGGGWQHGTRNHIYIYICIFFSIHHDISDFSIYQNWTEVHFQKIWGIIYLEISWNQRLFWSLSLQLSVTFRNGTWDPLEKLELEVMHWNWKSCTIFSIGENPIPC